MHASREPPAYRHSLVFDVCRITDRLEAIRSYPFSTAIMHCNDVQALKSWGPVAKLMGIPLVYHHRSLNRMNVLKRRVIALSDHAACISAACWENLSFLDRRTMVADPVEVGPDDDRSCARERLIDELGADRSARLVGFVANFHHRKRPFFFLDVCAHLRGMLKGFHGVMFGRSGEIPERQVRAYAERIGVSGCVSLVGFRLPPDRNIAALDLLLAPALDEPFGLTLVEALLLGVPYVATSSAGHIETYRRWKGGRLVADGASPAEFASAAADVLSDPAGVAIRGPALASVRQEVSPERHAERIMAIYEAIMDRDAPLAAQIGVRLN